MLICAAGKGNVSKEECLVCALSRNNKCGFEYALLYKMLEIDNREGIHVSDLTGCLRKAFYNRTQEGVPEYIHHRIAAFVGKSIHGYLEDVDQLDYQTEVKVSGWGTVGTADVVYSYEGALKGRLVDYKSVRKLDRFLLPYPAHALQLNIYAAMLERAGTPIEELYVQYIATDGPSRCPACRKMVVPGGLGMMCPKCGRSKVSYHPGVYLVRVEKASPEDMRALIESRTNELDACVALGSPPKGEPSAMCSFCKFMDICPDKEVE